MLRRLSWLVCLGLMLGCKAQKGRVLGRAPDEDPRNVSLALGGESRAKVVMQGVMVEKCPVAGCWFRLEDKTGTIKVDTKGAGFAVTAIPIGTTVTVGGKVDWDGSETVIQATGLRY